MKSFIFLIALAALFATATASAGVAPEWFLDESTCGPCRAVTCPGNGLKECQFVCRLCNGGLCEILQDSECNAATQPAFQNVMGCELTQDLCNRWFVDLKNCTDCRRESCSGDAGFQFCNVICINYAGQPVPNQFCSGTAPSSNSIMCTPEPCTFSWYFDKESCSECEGPCGSQGIKSCVLSCVDQFGNHANAANCLESSPPNEVTCETAPCQYEWSYSSWSECTGPCGVDCKRFRTRTISCVKIENGMRVQVAHEFCRGKPVQTLQEPCDSIPCTYEWDRGDWSDCIPLQTFARLIVDGYSVAPNANKPCGPGYQVATVVCLDQDGNIADPSNCDPATRPESKKGCDFDPCPTYEWIYDDWTDCRGDCETGGMRYRRATCFEINGNNAVESDNCGDHLPLSEECDLQIDCRTCKWSATRWGDCRGPCGLNEGVRYRKVHCQCDDGTVAENSVCEEQTGVVWTSSETCITDPCETSTVYNWIVTNCLPCTPLNYITARLGERDPCGDGVSICEVKCYDMNTGDLADDINCRHIKIPQHTFPCSFRPCKTTWVFSYWGPCSTTAPCIRTRTVDCMNEMGNIVSDRYCEGEKPVEMEKCECPGEPAPVDCTCGAWCEWSPCTTNCGQGTQTRYRRCKEAQHGGRTCQALGLLVRESRPCFARDCPVDCHCTAWQVTRNCSVPCGGGTMQLSRKCTEGTNGGLSCQALGLTTLTLTQACNECPCSSFANAYDPTTNRATTSYATGAHAGTVLSRFVEKTPSCTCGAWSAWSVCSASCGGFMIRTRQCVEYPGGITCEELGLSGTELRTCGIPDCTSEIASAINTRESFDSATNNLLSERNGVTFVNDGFIGNSAKFTDGYAQINLAADNNVQSIAFWLKADPSKTIAYGILVSLGKGFMLTAVPRFDIADNIGSLFYALELPTRDIIISDQVVDKEYHNFVFTSTAYRQDRVDPRMADPSNPTVFEKLDDSEYKEAGIVGKLNSANQFEHIDSRESRSVNKRAASVEAYLARGDFYVDGRLMGKAELVKFDEYMLRDRLQADLATFTMLETYKFDAIYFGYRRPVRTQNCFSFEYMLAEYFNVADDERFTLTVTSDERLCHGGHLVNYWVDELTTYCYPLIAREVRSLYEIGKRKLATNVREIGTTLGVNSNNRFIANAQQLATAQESSSVGSIAIVVGAIAAVSLIAIVVVRAKTSRKSELVY